MERYKAAGRPKEVDGFVNDSLLKWSRNLKRHLVWGDRVTFNDASIRTAAYRPYSTRFLYLADVVVDESSKTGLYAQSGEENPTIAVSDIGFRSGFATLAVSGPCDLHLCASADVVQVFPLYTYDEDGTNRRDNITDWALSEFRSHYGQKSISKRDIFHYTYGLLHHPEYRTRYAANLKRELPRIPFAPAFSDYARIGADLMKLHLEYENQREYPLQPRETGKLDWRVEKMSLSKDKTATQVQRLSHAKRHPAGDLRIPPRQSQRPRMGHRPIPRLH